MNITKLNACSVLRAVGIKPLHELDNISPSFIDACREKFSSEAFDEEGFRLFCAPCGCRITIIPGDAVTPGVILGYHCSAHAHDGGTDKYWF